MTKSVRGAAGRPALADISNQGRTKRSRKSVIDSLRRGLARAVQQAVPIAEQSEGADAAGRLTSALQAFQAALDEISQLIGANGDASQRGALLDGLYKAMWHTANVVSMADRRVVQHALQSSRTKAPSEQRRRDGEESRRLLDDAVFIYAQELGEPLKAGIKFASQHQEKVIAKLPPSSDRPSPDMIKKSIARVNRRLAESRGASSK